MADYEDDDLGAMQTQLGLAARGSISPLGIPTPAPRVRHPSEAARDAVMQTQSAAMQTMQTTAMLGGAPSGFGRGSALSGFAAQYGENMASIRANQLNPWTAGLMSSMMGERGYIPGMLPSPIQMTPPYMGIYRPMSPPPMMTVPPVQPQPLFPGPFTPTLPPPMFNTYGDRSAQLNDVRTGQIQSLALSAPGIAARLGAGAAGGYFGEGLGALAGARLGGLPGAVIGGALGAAGGFLGTEHFLGRGIQGLVDEMNPLAPVMRHGIQARAISQDFVFSGPSLDVSGRGLNPAASARLGSQLRGLAGESSFQRETGGAFSTQDLMKITSLAGQNGLLDMAQSPEQITSQVRVISKAFKEYMKLVHEPDVVEAIKQLGKMKGMGLSIGESMLAVERARTYSRMAGTSVQGVMEMGALPGAMLFQQMGLSAGLGANVGMGALGMARQAVAGNSFTPSQLSMLGGVQGVAQNHMEMAAAMLKQPLMAASMSAYNPMSGGFQLDPRSVYGLARGQQNISDLANAGATNMMRAVASGGIGALGAFQMDQPELQNQLGQALGPEGTLLMGFRQVLNTRRMLGVSGRGGLFAAAKAMNMSDSAARQTVEEMGSPQFFQNMQQQIRMRQNDERARAREERLNNTAGILDTLEQNNAPFRALRSYGRSASIGADSLTTGISAWFASGSEDRAAARQGGFIARIDPSLLARGAREARAMSRIDYRDVLKSVDALGADNGYGGRDMAIWRSATGRDITGQVLPDFMVQPAEEFMYGFRSLVFSGPSAAEARSYYESQGGATQTLGRLSFLVGGKASADQIRATARNRDAGARLAVAGEGATAMDRANAFSRISGNVGSDKAAAFRAAYSNLLIDEAKKRKSYFGENGMLVHSDYESLTRKAESIAGIRPGSVSVNDAVQVSFQDAKVGAGKANEGAFRAIYSTGEEGHLSVVDAAVKRQEEQGKALLGEQSGFSAEMALSGAEWGAELGGVLGALGGGLVSAGLITMAAPETGGLSLAAVPEIGAAAWKGSRIGTAIGGAVGGVLGGLASFVVTPEGDRIRREKTMELLFSGDDERVGTLASLMAAAQLEGTGSAAAKRLEHYQTKLSKEDPKKVFELSEKAQKLFADAEKSDETKGMLARAGKTLTGMSFRNMQDAMSAGQKQKLANQQALIYKKGIETFIDKDVYASFQGSEHDKLFQALKSGKVKGAEMETLAKGFSEASSAEQEARIQKAYMLGSNAGYASEKELRVVEGSAKADKKAQVDSEAAAEIETDAAVQFPDAVKSFYDASKALQKAADQLGNATSMQVPY